MNILIVNQSFDVNGGSDVMARLSADVLRQQGHTVHFFAARSPDQADDGIHPGAAHFFDPSLSNVWRFMYSPVARQRLDAFLDETPIDVAHLHIHYGTLTSSILQPLKNRGIRIVQHLHEYRSFCSVSVPVRNDTPCSECRVGSYRAGLMHRCNRGSLLRSAVSTTEMYVADRLGAKALPELFLTVSNFQRSILEQQGMPAEKMRTLYNPVHDDFFSVKPTYRGGALFIGRLEHYKGIYDVIKVAKRLPDLPFRIVGTGSQEEPLREMIAQMGLTNVKMTGNQTRQQVLDHLAWAKISLVPSRWHETFGLTAAESMAAGVPVIVTNMGGLPEVVEHGKSGHVVEMGDVKGLTNLCEQLWNSTPHREQAAKSGMARASRMFSQKQFSQNLAKALTQEK